MSDGFQLSGPGGAPFITSGAVNTGNFSYWHAGAPFIRFGSDVVTGPPSREFPSGVLLTSGPEWRRSGVKLKLSIPTARTKGLTGREARRPMGETLRLSMKWKSVLTAAQMADLRVFMQEPKDQFYVVPLWPFSRAGSDWENSPVTSGLLVAWMDGWTDFTVDTAEAIEGDNPEEWDFIAPCAVGHIKAAPQTVGAEHVVVDFDFEEDSPAEMALVPDPVTWNEGPELADEAAPPVWPFLTLWNRPAKVGAAEVAVERRDIGFSRVGSAAYWGGLSERPMAGEIVLTDREQVARFLRWWMDRRGDVEPHFLPTLTSSGMALTASASAGATTITVSNPERIGGNRLLVLESETAREWVRVAGIVDSVFTLSAPLAYSWTPAHARISLGMLARHAKAEIEIAFQTPGVARVTGLSWREVTTEINPADGENRGTTIGAMPTLAWLYELTVDRAGSLTVYRFTSFETEVAAAGQSWTPHGIEHSELRRTVKLDREELALRMRYAAPLDVLAPGRLDCVLRLAVIQCSVVGGVGSGAATVFTGELTGAKATGPFYDLTFSGASAVFERPAPRFLMQRGCNHAVYSAGCGLSVADWMFTATVVSVSGSSVVLGSFAKTGGLPTGWGFANYFALGYVEGAGNRRAPILTSAAKTGSDQVTLTMIASAPSWLVADASVTIVPGCDGTPKTCGLYHATTNPTGKFNNFVRFGGFPELPDKSPEFQPLKSEDAGEGKK